MESGAGDVHALLERGADVTLEWRPGGHEIDSGAVILTGTALERKNSRAVAELFAIESSYGSPDDFKAT